jgi:hypothetical protein
MQNHIHHLSHTHERGTTRLLNEHPLTKYLTEKDLHMIIEKCCTIPITKQVVQLPSLPTCEVTAVRISWLIQNGELVCNIIINSYYEVICSVSSGIFYMDPSFLDALITEEWETVARQLHGERRRYNDPYGTHGWREGKCHYQPYSQPKWPLAQYIESTNPMQPMYPLFA